MTQDTDSITAMYAAFNRRDIDAVLANMTETVNWPKASEGGRVIGKDEIRAYWTRQWAAFDPHVEPRNIVERPDGKIEVEVHQTVKTLDGQLLSDEVVGHTYVLADGLIERMDLTESASGRTGFEAHAHS